jgi:CheY-specific phosphatase CheX
MTLFDLISTSPGIIERIQESVHETLKIYARSEISPKSHFFKLNTGNDGITIIGVLDLKENDNTSVLSLGLSHAAFVKIYENMFHEKLLEVSLETADLAGELINIIFQSFDPELRKLGHVYEASLPRVLTSNSGEWITNPAGQSLVLPFGTECGDILFEVFETKGRTVCQHPK